MKDSRFYIIYGLLLLIMGGQHGTSETWWIEALSLIGNVFETLTGVVLVIIGWKGNR